MTDERWNIVVGTDGSDGSRVALELAARLAARIEAEVTAVHVLEPPYPMVPYGDPPALTHDDGSYKDRRQEEFEEGWCAPLRDAGLKYRTVMVEGSPAQRIIEIARSEDAALIVTGARGRGGFKELLLGSVSHSLTHHAGRPVMVVPAPR